MASGAAALVLSRARVTRGLSLLEPDALGELETVELQATLALAYCPRCKARPRVLPCDVLPYKRYSVVVIAAAAGAYTAPDWAQSLRGAVWAMLGERTPSHTTLHAWTEGLGAHALGLPAGEFSHPSGGWPFARVLDEAEARVPEVGSVWPGDVWVDPRRYRSQGRRERLAAVARVLAVAETLSETPPPDALAAWRGLIVRWSASFGLRFPTGLLCTGIEHIDPCDRRSLRSASIARSRPTEIPPMPDPYTVAAWRFEQIAPLVDASLDEGARRAALRTRTRTPVEWPGAEARRRRGLAPKKRPIPKSTLYRWVAAYQSEGYLGLMPKGRADRGKPRHARTPEWIHYAIALLYEQPQRSLTQLEVYLELQFDDYRLSRSTLNRHLQAHPAYRGIERLRRGEKTPHRERYEALHPHEGWQLDSKGPFLVRFETLGRQPVHAFTVLDDHSRFALAGHLAHAPSTEAAITVFESAGAKWGLADRFQFDKGSAFESTAFRQGLAQLGIHRNAVKARTPQWQGKIEAYHRALIRWFVSELRAQVVIDLEHLQQLLEAMLALVYNRHHHRELGTTPDKRLAGRLSERRVSRSVLARAFFVHITAKTHPKTGEVRLANGRFRVPGAYAGQRLRFAYHPVHPEAVLLTREGRELTLEPFAIKPLSAVKPQTPKRGTGQLQKLLDRFAERPLAEPGFGLPEVFTALGKLAARTLPESEREAHAVAAFYRHHGPLARDAFTAACERTRAALGTGRALSAYLEDLTRQVHADANTAPSTDDPTDTQPED